MVALQSLGRRLTMIFQLHISGAFKDTEKPDIENTKQDIESFLLREMTEQGIIEPVSGYGKGKYRFR